MDINTNINALTQTYTRKGSLSKENDGFPQKRAAASLQNTPDILPKKVYTVSLSSAARNNSISLFDSRQLSDEMAFERNQALDEQSKTRELESEKQQFIRNQETEKQRFEEQQRLERIKYLQQLESK